MAESELQKAAAKLMASIQQEAIARQPKVKALLKAISGETGDNERPPRTTN